MEKMRLDVKRTSKAIGGGGSDAWETYSLVRQVYRSAIFGAQRRYLETMLSEKRQPDIFRIVRTLEKWRTLSSMLDDCGNLVVTHEGVSDLIVAQLCPGEPAT